MRGVSLKEKVLLAQGLAATPEERLRMHDDYLRSLGLYSHWQRKKFGFKLPLVRVLKSKKTVLRDKDLAHIPHIERVLRAQRKLGKTT